MHDKSASQSTDPHVVPGLNALHSDRMEMTSRPVESKRDLSHNGHVDDKKMRAITVAATQTLRSRWRLSRGEMGIGESSGASEARRSPPNSPVVYHVRRALAANLRIRKITCFSTQKMKIQRRNFAIASCNGGRANKVIYFAIVPLVEISSTLIRAFLDNVAAVMSKTEGAAIWDEDNGRSQTIRLRELNGIRRCRSSAGSENALDYI